ncbi:MAG: UvrB/UvrC motif-containing protein [Bacillota bacterium]|nr:UvrB/UvrC motif-containing protein [Bacillota bacterium]
MLCAKCGKNEATVYFSSNINGKETEYNVCQDCAKELGLFESFNKQQKLVQNNFFGGSFFGGNLFEDFDRSMRIFDRFMSGSFNNGFFAPLELEEQNTPEQDKCPYCGHTLEDFNKTGKLGCAMCYETFKDKLDPVNVGAAKKEDIISNKKETAADKIAKLHAKINDAIKAEKYEDAAKLRDEIKKLESKEK